MEQGNQNIPEKYSRGEHLKADTVNWLIDRAADSAAAKRVYKSDIEAYILDEIDEAAFDDSYQIPKPFDISCDVQQGVLAGVTLNNCLFYDGSEEVDLGNVDLTAFTNVSTIWLEKSLTATSDKYQIATTSTDTSASYYRLYDIDSTSGNFFVKCDYRDAHIEIGGISGGGGGGDCSCDLSVELTSGTKIAAWTKDGVNWTDIYCLSGSGCSCDLTAYLTSGTKIADWTKDGVNVVEIYAPSGGGPEPGTETTLSGNTSSSEKIGPGDLSFEAMTSCNISVETTGTTIKLGVYYI